MTKYKMMGTAAVALLGVAAAAAPALAGRVNTSGIACKFATINNTQWSVTSPPFHTYIENNGVGVSNPDTNQHDLYCPVPRNPGTLPLGLYVDGDNKNGVQTNCVVARYDYTGTLLGTSSGSQVNSFPTSAASYDITVSFPAAAGTFDYLMLKCGYFAANKNAVLRGVTTQE